MKQLLLSALMTLFICSPLFSGGEDAKTASAESELKQDEYDLLRCIQTALENNSEIRKAKQRIEKQRGISIQARAGLLPRIALNSNFNQIDRERLQSFGGGSFGTQNDWAVNVEVIQSIYTGGRVAHQIHQENLKLDASLLDFKRVVADVLLQVREQYYAVLLAREQWKVQELHMGLLWEELKTEQNRFKAGAVSQFNVLRAEVEHDNSKPAVLRSRNNLRTANDKLRNIIGLPSTPDHAPLKIVGEFQFTPKSANLDAALISAQEHRPELKQLEKASLAEKEKIEVAVSGYKPTVDLVAGYGAEKSRFSSSLKEEVHGWTAGVRGTWTIFDGFATTGKVKEAVADYKISIINLEQQRLDIDAEVRQAHSLLLEASQLMAASEKVITQAEESLRIAKSRLGVGAGTQLDVLAAQVALTQARTNEILALHDYNVAQARLARSTGQAEQFEVKENE
jgi:outer membrane protein